MNTKEALASVRNVMRRKHLALSTERCYCEWLVRFFTFCGLHPEIADRRKKIEAFLSELACDGCAASTQNQAFNAVLFFTREVLGIDIGDINALRAKRPAFIRVAPTRDEVQRLLAAVKDTHGYPTRLICYMLYGCGLRVSEPLNLRIRDVQIEESRIIIRQAKGGKDRMVALPCQLSEMLRVQLVAARATWEQDKANGVPVALPGRLGIKYPHAAFSWQWAWVFPSRTTCACPRTRKTVRWRCHEANVQRTVAAAARPLGLMVTPHHLRHAYATHCINAGASVRDVQSAMGHANLETTMGYITPDALRVRSPLASVL